MSAGTRRKIWVSWAALQNSEGDDRRIRGVWCLGIECTAELERLCVTYNIGSQNTVTCKALAVHT